MSPLLVGDCEPGRVSGWVGKAGGELELELMMMSGGGVLMD